MVHQLLSCHVTYFFYATFVENVLFSTKSDDQTNVHIVDCNRFFECKTITLIKKSSLLEKIKKHILLASKNREKDKIGRGYIHNQSD